MNIRKLQT